MHIYYSCFRNISKFIVRGRYGEVFNISAVNQNTYGSFEALVSWTPLPTDIGPRIVCASALDTAGYGMECCVH